MANFTQFTLEDLMLKLSYDQLVYWYEMSNWKEYKVEPSITNYDRVGQRANEKEFEEKKKQIKKSWSHTSKGWIKNG